MSRTPWIVTNCRSQLLECQRCGAAEPLHLPDRIEIVLTRMKLFIREHKGCKVKATP